MKVTIIISGICLALIGCTGDRMKNARQKISPDLHAIRQVVSANSGHKDQAALTDSIIYTVSHDSLAFRETTDYLAKVFGDPNSPYRNESVYMNVLRLEINSRWYDSTAKADVQKKLLLTMQNRPGTQANDFTYITPAGLEKKMYDIQAPFTLLYFYNPECPACIEMTAALCASETVLSGIKNESIAVLAVYTDKDETIWRKHLHELPEGWMHGRDIDEYLYRHDVYNLKAIPTLYLLDADKKVILKDVTEISVLENQLINNP